MVDRGNFKTWKSSFAFVDERVKSQALVDAKVQLPDNFEPSEFSVLCGRGRECYEHIGNRRFREIAAKHAQRYAQARTKMEKSIIVMEVIDAVRAKATIGGFVKKNPKNGRWIDIGDDAAREKVGQQFRTALGITSSNRNKTAKSKKVIISKQKTTLGSGATATKTTTTTNLTCDTSRASLPAVHIKLGTTLPALTTTIPTTTTTNSNKAQILQHDNFTTSVEESAAAIMPPSLRTVSTTTMGSSGSHNNTSTNLAVTNNDSVLTMPQQESAATTSTSLKPLSLSVTNQFPMSGIQVPTTDFGNSNNRTITNNHNMNLNQSQSYHYNQNLLTKRVSVNHDDLFETSRLLLEDIPSDEEFFHSFNIHDKAASALVIDDFEPVLF